jgi:transcriptional regulator with XRE-family HTH domain/Zn-dependent peptidase ImmA (M78 family)
MAENREWAEVGEQIRQIRLATGVSQGELGDLVGLDRTMIAKIEAGSRRVDALELVKLSSALRVPMDHLVQPQPAVLSRRADLVVEDGDTEVARESQRLEMALVAWLRDVRQLVDLGLLRLQPLLTYSAPVESPTTARAAALWVRERLGFGAEPIETLIELSARCGQFVLVTELPGDGASIIDSDVAAAVVSLRGDPGRRRATAAHELGHLILGDEYSSDLGIHASRAEREAAIDAFAAELLLPTQVLVAEGNAAGGVSRDQLVHLAARYRTSWSLALRQAEHAGVLEAYARRRWSQSSPTRAEFLEALGWAPQPDLESVRVPPDYAHAVMEAWRKALVTSARAVELMHGQISGADLPTHDEPDVEP